MTKLRFFSVGVIERRHFFDHADEGRRINNSLLRGGNMQTWRPPSASGDVTHTLAQMLLSEPVVRQGLRVLQSHCLCGGLTLRFGKQHNVPPTPSFMRHVEHVYLEFCRQAIESFMAVGFAPYRIRRMENGVRVPELLPLGTYSWHVARHASAMSTPWFTTRDGRLPCTTTTKQEEETEDGPLLRYEVQSAYCKETVHVYAFTPPHPLFVCAAPLVSVIPNYLSLCSKRECVARADAFNSQPSIVLEQQVRTKINDFAKSGATIATPVPEAEGRMNEDKGMMEGRQKMYYEILGDFRERSRLPLESVAMIAPTNHTIHGLDRVVTPLDMATAELAFSRRVASALGIPETMLLQGSQAVGARSSSMGSSPSWSECAESSNRQLLDLCRHVNRHLERLLCEAYEHIYGAARFQYEPIFRLMTVPTFSLEQILQVWNAKLVDDGVFSAILEATWGAPLGKDAVTARVEQRKAEFELPFRDKADPASKLKKK